MSFDYSKVQNSRMVSSGQDDNAEKMAAEPVKSAKPAVNKPSQELIEAERKARKIDTLLAYRVEEGAMYLARKQEGFFDRKTPLEKWSEEESE